MPKELLNVYTEINNHKDKNHPNIVFFLILDKIRWLV